MHLTDITVMPLRNGSSFNVLITARIETGDIYTVRVDPRDLTFYGNIRNAKRPTGNGRRHSTDWGRDFLQTLALTMKDNAGQLRNEALALVQTWADDDMAAAIVRNRQRYARQMFDVIVAVTDIALRPVSLASHFEAAERIEAEVKALDREFAATLPVTPQLRADPGAGI